ncbi:MAG TPA: hypothetical protein VGF51_07615 [Acidimicrobiales bacterium]
MRSSLAREQTGLHVNDRLLGGEVTGPPHSEHAGGKPSGLTGAGGRSTTSTRPEVPLVAGGTRPNSSSSARVNASG